MVQVSAEEARNDLPRLIDAAVNGQTVFITQDGQGTVQLVPITYSKGKRQSGSAKGLIHIADDFDAPLEEFKEYMK